MKTLVADDELTTRLVLQEILSGYGEVHSCVDGSEAVAAFTRALENGGPYDLVCMDLLMPKMDGFEALRLIRREEESRGRFRPRATKVIITTASDDDESINQAFRGLCDAYIVKPVDTEALVGLVHCLLPAEEPGR